MEQIPGRLAAKPSWLISQLAVHARRLSFEVFAAAGAKGYHYRVLASLEEFGPASQAQIGRWCRMDRSDVVAAVNQLAELGFVDREPDPDHGRRNRVTLTKAGARQLRNLDGELEKVQEELLNPLSAEERQVLAGLLGRVLAEREPTAS